MRDIITRDFFKDRAVFLLTVTVLLIGLFNTAYITFFLRPQEFEVPLRFSAIGGNSFEMTGEWYNLYMLVAFAVIVTTLNILLGLRFYRSKRPVTLITLSISILVLVIHFLVSRALLSQLA